MGTAVRSKLEERVIRAAGAALTDHHYVTSIDVLVGMGWLTTSQVDQWRRGRDRHGRFPSLGQERGAAAQ